MAIRDGDIYVENYGADNEDIAAVRFGVFAQPPFGVARSWRSLVWLFADARSWWWCALGILGSCLLGDARLWLWQFRFFANDSTRGGWVSCAVAYCAQAQVL